MSHRVMILGAGSTGRGHIGQLAAEAGWHLILVDRDPELVRCLRTAGRYTVDLHGVLSHRRGAVSGFDVFHIDETEALVHEGLHVSLILTSLFSHNLPHIAPLIAAIVSARAEADIASPLNVICCENMQDGSSVLKSLVMPMLGEAATRYAETLVGFPNCMVSRVVPVAENPLELVAEDYNEWTVDATGFVGPAPDLRAMELVDNQEARLARKFFMHNGAHAVCGYWGFHRGHTYIHEAIADPQALQHVLGAIDELAPVVARRYCLDPAEVRDYGLELGGRGAVAQIRDLVLRVVRDPLRKLSRDERLTAPAVLAHEYGLPHAELVKTMAAALRYSHPDDPQSVSMQDRLREDGATGAIPKILGLPPEHPIVAEVASAYEGWPNRIDGGTATTR